MTDVASNIAFEPWTASTKLASLKIAVLAARFGPTRPCPAGPTPPRSPTCRPGTDCIKSPVHRAGSFDYPSLSWTTCSNTNGSRYSPDIAGGRPAKGASAAGREAKLGSLQQMTGQIKSMNQTARLV